MASNSKSTKKTDEGLFFPSNIVPAEKDKQISWSRQWVEAIRRYSYFTVNQSRDIELYNYAQGRVNDSDFAHVTQMFFDNKPGGAKRALPSKLRPVNSINHILTRIMGKWDAVDLKFTANAVNEDAITRKFDKFADKVVEKAARYVRQTSQVGEIVGQPLVEGDDVMPENPKDIEEMHITNFHEENEIYVSQGLKYLLTKKRNNLKWRLNHKMGYNYLITGKMAWDNYIEYGDPDGFCIDSRFLIYDLEAGSPFLHDGRFNGYWFPATPQQVIEMCPELSEEDLRSIDELSKMFLAGKAVSTTSPFWYREGDTGMYYLNCYKIYWKAVKWTKCIIEPNKFDKDNPHVFFVGEDEQPKEGQKVEYRPINTWWECTRLGEDIYYQCREIPNQQRPLDMPHESWSPIVGFVDELPSPVQVLQPFDAMKKIAYYSLERLIGQAKGKILIVDEATEEDGQQNLYNMMAFNVYKINSAKEGEQQLGMNQRHIEPKEIDLGLSQAVSDLMRFIGFLDMQMSLVTGVNEASQGILKSDTGLGVTQAAIESAQLTLQPYYYNFYNMCETVLQSQANLMKQAWGGKSKIGWILGDNAKEFFSIDAKSDWHLDDYGIFVETGVKSEQNKQLILKMAEQLLPTVQEPEMALSIIKMFNAASGTEAEKILEKGIEAVQKLKDAAQQFQASESDKALQVSQANAQAKAEADKEKADVLKQVAIINAKSAEDITNMKLNHKEDEDSVRFKNEVLASVAKHLLEKDKQENAANLDMTKSFQEHLENKDLQNSQTQTTK